MKKTKKANIIIGVFAAIVCFFVLEVASTNSLWEKIIVAFNSKEENYYLDDIGIPRSLFMPERDLEIERVESEIKRVFVIHNFFDGYIWASYSREVYDKSGDMLCGGKTQFPRLLKLKIHRENGIWKIVDAYDPP